MKKDLLNLALQKLPTTDVLAMQRTVLGNTRTFLAIIRTAMTLLAVGVGLLQLLTHAFFHFLAVALMGLSVVVFVFGIIDYVYFHRKIRTIIQFELDKL